jgi:hypothetical protein
MASAKKIKRVGLQSLGARQLAGNHLNREHGGVEGDDQPKPAFVIC